MSTNATTRTTADVRVVQLQSLTDEELDQLITIFVEAFKDDPFSVILLGNDLTLAPSEFRAHLRAALIDGAIHALSVGPRVKDIHGVAVWYPPNKSLFSTAEARAAGWDQFLASIPEELRTWWSEYFGPTMGALSSTSLGPGKLLSSWHLHLFAVHPEYQGKGFGRALIEYAESLARKDRVAMILETTTDVDVKIYTKLGFRVCGETGITSPHGEALVRLMIKEYMDDTA